MLTPEEVRHVAMLARLGITDEEVETLRGQLAQVLDYIEVLQEVDTSSVAPTAQILTHLNISRADEARPSLPVDLVLQNAPGKREDFFSVPSVFEEFKPEPGAAGEVKHEQ